MADAAAVFTELSRKLGMLAAMLIDYSKLPRWFRQVELKEFAGEKIHWAGMPNATVAMRGGFFLWLFAVPWTAFTLFWEISVLRSWLYSIPNGKGGPAGFGLVLWGIPFVLVGLGMLSFPYFAARAARRTVHVLTDKRMVTVRFDRNLHVETLNLRAITRIKRSEKQDRSGTLVIELDTMRDSEGSTTRSETFYGIRDVHAVELLLRDVMEQARPSSRTACSGGRTESRHQQF